jgi:translocation and assembly module TamB
LRDSLFLADIRAFMPSGERSVAQRPPYFSVDTPPLNHWELGIEVVGDRFMRLRTTVFNGVASARFHLDGTLGEPRAIGEVTINEGQVLFPFATFSVDRGSVRLSQENPFEPRLSVNGSARRYDYDVQMEITGTAADPKLTFTSNPPLESEQVLLMVMAGEVPRTDYSKSNQQRLTAIGTYLGQSLFENFGGDSGSGDRLAITSGERISTEGKETYTIEYRLNDRFSLVGEYDEYDDYNAGIKWRVLRGEGKREK